MKRHTRRAALVAALMLTATTAACGGRADTGENGSPGITDDKVVLGQSFPFSGNLSVFTPISKAAQAVFDSVNAKGGVTMGDGVQRKVELVALDDGYDPSRTLANVKNLVTKEQVFAIFNLFGTAPNVAVLDYTTREEVPQILGQVGISSFGADPGKTPYAMGVNPPYSTEAGIFAASAEAQNPRATFAVLYQNDDQGEDYLHGLEAALDGTEMSIVAKESYQPTDASVESQVVNLARSGADVFLNLTTPKFGAQAVKAMLASQWRPSMYLPTFCAGLVQILSQQELEAIAGTQVGLFGKDPALANWKDDPAVTDYLAVVDKYGDGAFEADDAAAVNGALNAQIMIKLLESAKEPTREALMDAARSMDYSVPLMIDGVALSTATDDPFPLESLAMSKLEDGNWVPVEVANFDGLTAR